MDFVVLVVVSFFSSLLKKAAISFGKIFCELLRNACVFFSRLFSFSRKFGRKKSSFGIIKLPVFFSPTTILGDFRVEFYFSNI